MSYGTSFKNAHHLAGIYTADILKGEKPDNLPVQQSTKFEFAINAITAKTLLLTIPPSQPSMADEVTRIGQFCHARLRSQINGT